MHKISNIFWRADRNLDEDNDKKTLKVHLLYILHTKMQVQLIPKISGINMSYTEESPT